MSGNAIFEISIYHGYILQILLAEILFTFTLKRRRCFVFRVIAGGMIFGVLSIIVPNMIAQYVSGVFSLSIFLLSLGYCMFCFENQFWQILFCCVGAQLVQNLSYNVENLFYQPFSENLSYISWFFISLTTTIVVYTGCYFLFARHLRNMQGVGMNKAGGYVFSIITALFVYIMQYLFQFYGIQHWIIRPPLILCCIFGLCVQFEWIALADRKVENQMLEEMIQKERRQYEITKNSMDLINLKAHDLKHQITRIRNLGDVKDQELDEIEAVIEQYETNSITGNRTLDIILTEKQFLCRENDIQITIMADGEALYWFKSADLASMFGNALDNAIECECTIKNHEQRYIVLDVHRKGNLLSIRVENYCPYELSFINGLPKSTKSDQNNHGFGMKSIKYIAEKYEGTVQVGVKNNLFILSILFQMPVERQDLPK